MTAAVTPLEGRGATPGGSHASGCAAEGAMARITLEDLDGLGEEAAAGGGEDGGGEAEAEAEERGRLFAHWEAVASTHRVNLPRGER